MVAIRAATPADAAALAELHLDVWEEAYAGLIPRELLDGRRAELGARVRRWRERLAPGPARTWVAEGEHRLVGYATAGPGRDDGDDGLELMAIYVRAEAYGTGLGHALLQTAIGDRPAYLWVLDGNTRGIAFYERQGFRFDGRTKTEAVGVERRMVRPWRVRP